MALLVWWWPLVVSSGHTCVSATDCLPGSICCIQVGEEEGDCQTNESAICQRGDRVPARGGMWLFLILGMVIAALVLACQRYLTRPRIHHQVEPVAPPAVRQKTERRLPGVDAEIEFTDPVSQLSVIPE